MTAALHLAPFELFSKATPYLIPFSLSYENIERIHQFSDLLPKAMQIKHFGFEYFLQGSRPVADIGFYLNLTSIDETTFKEWFTHALSPLLIQEEAWQRFVMLATKASEEKFLQKQAVHTLWFEFDIGSDLKWPSSPNLLFSFNQQHFEKNLWAVLELLDNQKALKQANRVLHLANRYDLIIPAIGFMLARASDWIQWEFRSSCYADILSPFLKEVGYCGDLAPLLRLIEKLCPILGKIDIQIDLNQTIGKKIGISCYPPSDLYSYRWEPLLEILVCEKLIHQEEQDALLSWIGATSQEDYGQKWHLVRYVSHFKIVYLPEGAFHTKIYLGAFQLHLSSGRNPALKGRVFSKLGFDPDCYPNLV